MVSLVPKVASVGGASEGTEGTWTPRVFYSRCISCTTTVHRRDAKLSLRCTLHRVFTVRSDYRRSIWCRVMDGRWAGLAVRVVGNT